MDESKGKVPLEIKGKIFKIYQRPKNHSLIIDGVKEEGGKPMFFSNFGTCKFKEGETVTLLYTDKTSADGGTIYHNITSIEGAGGFEKASEIPSEQKSLQTGDSPSFKQPKETQKTEITDSTHKCSQPPSPKRTMMTTFELEDMKDRRTALMTAGENVALTLGEKDENVRIVMNNTTILAKKYLAFLRDPDTMPDIETKHPVMTEAEAEELAMQKVRDDEKKKKKK